MWTKVQCQRHSQGPGTGEVTGHGQQTGHSQGPGTGRVTGFTVESGYKVATTTQEHSLSAQ